MGFCEGNNRAAELATGYFLLFLNNDAWLEPNALEILVQTCRSHNADAAGPLILNYDDDSFQSSGAEGFDFFGLPSARRFLPQVQPLFMPEGAAYFVSRAAFEKVGRFDPVLFMYADEYDLSWKLWIAGCKIISVPEAKVHHRGAANVNPAGGEKIVEFRTSDTKRFYANRNCLLVILKNAHSAILLLAAFQFLLLCMESLASLVLIRRWSYIRHAYFQAVADCLNMESHIHAERKKLSLIRRRNDLQMLRFLTWRFNRLDEIKRMISYGIPKVAAK